MFLPSGSKVRKLYVTIWYQSTSHDFFVVTSSCKLSFMVLARPPDTENVNVVVLARLPDPENVNAVVLTRPPYTKNVNAVVLTKSPDLMEKRVRLLSVKYYI